VIAEPIQFNQNAASLVIRITEGPRFVLSAVSISGAATRSEADVRRALSLQAGDRYSIADLERGRRAVEADYAREGFNAVRASTATQTDLSKGTVHVMLSVEEGPRQLLDRVVVEDVPGVDPGVIVDVLQLERGTPVNMDDWYQARRRLLDTGLFRRVDIEALPAAVESESGPREERIAARVTLDRQPPWRLRYGLDVTDEPAPAAEGRIFGAGLSADLQRRGLFGRAGSAGGTLRVNADQQIGRTFLSLPTFFERPIISSFFVSRSRERFEQPGFLTFVTDKTTFTAEQRVRLAGAIQTSYGYQFERNHTFDPDRDPDDPLGLDLLVNAARLTSTTTVDTRDDPFDARRGLFHSSSLEYAATALGSDVRFIKYVAQQFVFVPFGRGLLSASAVRMGLGRGFGQDLLPSERFFAGGAGTVRGFPDNSLGTADFLGEPLGGHAMVVLNQELRIPLYRWLRAVGFVDAGNVFGTVSDISLRDLAVGAGGGLRLTTPFGLFRVDLGVPLNWFDDRRRARWHFSFGQMF
jgi:outer membrane protein assembly complex protein YaeT